MGKYKYLGSTRTVACTPTPIADLSDTRTCRERNNCTRECMPKTLECPRCHQLVNKLGRLEDVQTGETFDVCYNCEKELESM